MKIASKDFGLKVYLKKELTLETMHLPQNTVLTVAENHSPMFTVVDGYIFCKCMSGETYIHSKYLSKKKTKKA